MKYFKELSETDQEKVLNKLQDLPLFRHFREDARLLLMTSDLYIIDDTFKVHALAGKEEDNVGNTI